MTLSISHTPMACHFARLTRAIAGERWVLDGNYHRTAHVKWPRTQTVIWLDYSLPRKMYRLVKRTFWRWLEGNELWEGTGNRETLDVVFSRKSVLVIALRTHAMQRRRYLELIAKPPRPALQFVHLRSQRDADAFLTSIVSSRHAVAHGLEQEIPQ